MRKNTKAAVAGILSAVTILGSVAMTAGTAAAEETPAGNQAIIHYSTQVMKKDYYTFDGANTTEQNTITANVGDILTVTVSAKTNDPSITKFINGQCVTIFNADSTTGKLAETDNGVLSFYNQYYKNEDEEFIPLSYNEKLPSVIFNDEFTNGVFFNFTNQDNSINLRNTTKLYSFAVKVEKPGECNIVTGNFRLSYYDDVHYAYVNGSADLFTNVEVAVPVEQPTTVEPTTEPAEPTTVEPTTVAKPTTEPVEPSTEPATQGEPKDYLVGDVNGDGIVNGADAGVLNRYASSWKDYDTKIKNMKAADINNDGIVNGADAGILSRHVSGWKNYDRFFQ